MSFAIITVHFRLNGKRRFMRKFDEYIIVLLIIAAGFAFGYVVGEDNTKQKIKAELGRPIAYVNLPSGVYTVVKVVDKAGDSSCIAVLEGNRDIFFLVAKMPSTMMEEGYRFAASDAQK